MALWPAVMGNRCAIALLASLLYACALERLGVPFNWPEWLLADLFVLKAILGPNMTLQDELVAALFVLVWPAYFMDAQSLYDVGMQIVLLQLLIVLPWIKVQRIIFSISHGRLRPEVAGENS